MKHTDFYNTIDLLPPCAGRAEPAGEPRKERRGDRCNAGGLPRERERRAAERAEQRAKRPRNARSEHAAEKTEQQALRREYLDDIKASLRAQLNNTSIQEPDGTIHKLAKKD